MIFAMKQLWILFLLLIGVSSQEEKAISQEHEAISPELHISMIVFSDPHYFDPSLGTEGAAFERYLDQDRKLLRESAELLKEAVQMTLLSGVDMVLVPGDLTKDGTLVSHRGFADHLAYLEEQGMEVFVVPGNHDILNGESFAYREDSAVRVENVDPVRFEQIYGPYGYDEAILRDSFSLSYVAEPVDGLWIMGLDPCLYYLNDSLGHSQTDGEFRPETIRWLEEVLNMPQAGAKTKIAMMHHGVLEHYRGQEKHFGEYVVNDHKKLARLLARNGVQVVFTGHYHANDITMKEWNNGSVLFDVETGSLVTYPCPIRKIELTGDSMKIETAYIHSIPSRKNDFQEFAKSYVEDGVSGIAEQTLIDMKLRPEDAERLAFQIGQAFSAHYAGDEIPREPPIDTKGVNLKGRFIISFRKSLVRGLYHDLPPSDNNLSINLQSGSYR